MQLLLIKLSSLGDLVHTLPALTEAQKQCSDLQVDWMVEQAFEGIAALHPAVRQTLPVQLRAWKERPFRSLRTRQPLFPLKALRQTRYDLILDAQGLLKSALLGRLARAESFHGLDAHSVKEPLAASLYSVRHAIPKGWHAIHRIRQLFATSLGYVIDWSDPAPVDYGLPQSLECPPEFEAQPYVLFLHGTTWPSKHWPDASWERLGQLLNQKGLAVVLSFGNETEKKRAWALSQKIPNSRLLQKTSYSALLPWLRHAQAVVSVDSGLGHLATALQVPIHGLFGPTDVHRTGFLNPHAVHHTRDSLSCRPCLKKTCVLTDDKISPPPCLSDISPEYLFERLMQSLALQ